VYLDVLEKFALRVCRSASHCFSASSLSTMQFLGLISLVGLLGTALSAPSNLPRDKNALARLQKHALAALKAAEGNSTSSGGCSLSNAAVRKDWYACPCFLVPKKIFFLFESDKIADHGTGSGPHSVPMRRSTTSAPYSVC